MTRDTKRSPKPAYIFGGLEAIVLQGLIGGILGGMLVLKGYWRQVKAWFSGEKHGGPDGTHRPMDGESGENTAENE